MAEPANFRGVPGWHLGYEGTGGAFTLDLAEVGELINDHEGEPMTFEGWFADDQSRGYVWLHRGSNSRREVRDRGTRIFAREPEQQKLFQERMEARAKSKASAAPTRASEVDSILARIESRVVPKAPTRPSM